MEKKMAELGGRLYGDAATNVGQSLSQIARLMPLSRCHREILAAFSGAIVFDNGARYKPETKTPLTKLDGYNDLEMLYGLGGGPHSLEVAWSNYKGALPTSFMPIGEAPGGNIICIDSEGAVFLWDHESDRADCAWRVAQSLDHFLEHLEPGEPGIGSTEGIIESESFLDF